MSEFFSRLKLLASRSIVASAFGVVISDNIVTFRWVSTDAMSPLLVSGDRDKDLAVIARVTKFYCNDVVLYLNPNTGEESIGRLMKMKTTESLQEMRGKIPSGHCWIENDNPRSGDPDSTSFGAIPIGLLRGCVFGTVYPFQRSKLIVT